MKPMMKSPLSRQIKKSKGRYCTSFVYWESVVLDMVVCKVVLAWWSESWGHGGGGLGLGSLFCGGVRFDSVRYGWIPGFQKLLLIPLLLFM